MTLEGATNDIAALLKITPHHRSNIKIVCLSHEILALQIGRIVLVVVEEFTSEEG